MTANDFSILLREWRAARGLTDFGAACALGVPYATFVRWLNARCLPVPLTLAAVLRQVRDGCDPDVRLSIEPAEFARLVSEWRFTHGLTQPQAGLVLGVSRDVIGNWETEVCVPQQPALAEVLRRLRMPVNVPAVKARTKRPRPIEPDEFARQVRQWRRRHRLTQAEAGAVLGTTGRNVWVWETARALPRRPLAVLAQLAEPFTRAEPKVAAVLPPKPKPLMEPRQFAALLRRWRRGHRLTQAQACAPLGLPADAALISDYERGDTFPQPDRLRAILAAIASKPAPPPPPRIRPSPFARGQRKWRTFRGLTLAQAAAMLGCSVPSLCHYENGRVEPPPHRMAAILAVIED